MFIKGDCVKHPNAPDWGIGKVLENALDDKVKIFFVNVGEKLLNLKHVNLIKLEGVDAIHPILDNPGLADRGKGKKFKSLPQAKAEFLAVYPDGFEDGGYCNDERSYKIEAHKLMLKLLDEVTFKQLLEVADFKEICKRALQVVNKTNLIFPNEKMALKDGLATEKAEKLFAESLYSLLYGKNDLRERFKVFSDCLYEINAAKWTTMSYFLFITYPSDHMFLKPTVTQNSADLCAFELNYRSELNWLTYKCLLEFSAYLNSALVELELEPRDMIDVQSFMWCIAPNQLK